MDLGLADKIALVTGASSGIGAATAVVLAEEGADVIVGYHSDQQGAEQTAEAVRRLGRRAWSAQLDISDETSVRVAMERIAELVGRLDIAVLNAGILGTEPFADLSFSEWRRVLGTNLDGTFLTLHHCLSLFTAGGSIVTVSSVTGHTGHHLHAHYATSKAAVMGLTKSAALALAPDIRVNCVAPGMVETPMGEDVSRGFAKDYATSKLLSGRFARPDETARTIAFVASPASAPMYGATIDINSGRHLR